VRLSRGQFFGTTRREIEGGGIAVSTRDYAPLQEQPWHSHERATIFVHLVGDQLDETAQGEWTMPNLSLTYHPTSMPHRSRLGPSGARGVNIELSDEWLARNGITSSDLGSARVLDGDAARSAAVRVIRIYAPDPELDDLVVELIATMTEHPKPVDAPWIAKVEERMRAEFRDPLGLSQLATTAGVHPVHLARVFRHRHGRSVTEQLQRLRLQAAVRQILEGDSIGSAALDAGFADQFHFTRTLKAHFGYCPKLVKALRCFDCS
jgi:AraC family transcriptional regulator